MDRKEAEEFFNEWVWASPKRKTGGMGRLGAYKQDVVAMLVDATQKTKPRGEIPARDMTKEKIAEWRGEEGQV